MKQAILVRQDLKLSKGKLAVQVAHAAVETLLKSNKKKIKQWHSQGAKKIVLKVKNKKELFQYKKQAEKLGIVTALIIDAAKTFFKKPTITCLGLGPDKEEIIDQVSGKLKMV